MKLQLRQLVLIGKRLGLSVVLFLTIPASIVEAQVTPDRTLESTVQQIQELMKIEGGLQEGSNLFHSFEEFSIPEGMEAAFENALEIENIFTRVTGDSASTINGTLSAQGGANLFLINSNGIVFGQNASIDVGGSFIATTAESIQFDDGTELTVNSEGEPLLTNEIPVGLGFGSNSGAIEVNGAGNQITNDSSFSPVEFSQTPTGISLPNNQTLALVGNGIDLNGGVVTTESGQIDLVSVDSGTVGINQTETGFTVFNDGITKYQDINLDQQSSIDAGGEQSGDISVIGKNINLSNASYFLNQSLDKLSNGSIDVKASESLNISGTSADGDISSGIRTEAIDNGKGSNINISANQLRLQDDARIQAFTFNDMAGGSVKIEAPKAAILNGGFINASTRGNGNAGTLELSTSQLTLTNIGIVSSSSIGDNNGNAGEVIVNTDSIDISGDSTSSNRSNISTSSFTPGDAGSLTINTKQLRIANGGTVSSSSFNNGDAGDLIINASESIDVNGNNENFKASSSSESTIRTAVQVDTPDESSGNAGNLTINTPKLNVTEQASINVENQGLGKAGTLTVNARDINLESAGSITAATASGQGGNIELNIDTLQIENQSQITAEAEDESGGGNININATNITAKKDSLISANAEGGNGGNITIDSETILGLENSDITANAVEGDGGNITIDTDFVVGLEARPRLTQFSDITASSDLGVDGTVTVNAPDNNLGDDAVVVFTNYTRYQDRRLLERTCLNPSNSENGRLIYVGRGGIPENPRNFFGDEEVAAIEKVPTEEQRRETQDALWVEGDPIVNSNAVRIGIDGEQYLVAETRLKDVDSSICRKKENKPLP